MRPFYLNGMMRALVFALVGIFTPIFIFKLEGLGWVFGYYILLRIVTLGAAIPASKLIEKIGFRRSIVISVVFLAIMLSSLLLAEKNHLWIWGAAIVAGLNIPFYWIARSSAISQDGVREKIGAQMGWMSSVEQLATMLGPLTAGLIVTYWGFEVLFGLALLILVVSVVPLWQLPHHTHKNGASWRGFWYWVTNKRYFHNAVGIGARAVDDYSISVLWPLAIFGIGVKTDLLGGVFSLVALVALGVRIMIGKLFDRLHARGDYSDEWMFGLGAGGSAILWLVRIVVRSIGAIVGTDLLGAVLGTMYSSLYVDYEMLGGKRMGSIAYWVYAEMMYSIMAIWLFGMVAVGWYLGIWREVFMILAAFWVLISIIMARESNLK